MSDERQEISPEEMNQIKALLGIDAETFQRTKLGRYILDRAKMEEEEFIEALIICDPGDRDKIQMLQNEVYKRRVVPNFLQDAIQSGVAGRENLEQQEGFQTY